MPPGKCVNQAVLNSVEIALDPEGLRLLLSIISRVSLCYERKHSFLPK